MQFKRFARRPDSARPASGMVQTAPRGGGAGNLWETAALPMGAELRLYDALRGAIPIIDASLQKIIRLVGGFTISCPNPAAQRGLARFCREMPVGGTARGLESFVGAYLDDLLAYGGAVGELVLSRDGRHAVGLYNGDLRSIEVRCPETNRGPDPMRAEIWVRDGPSFHPAPDQARIFFTALNPRPGERMGRSILKGLPFVAQILYGVFEATGRNFERIGNVRYAVTYKPPEGELDRPFARERARQISRAWSEGMEAARRGQLSDFVCVGDVNVRAIGADAQLLDTNVPVRQMLEQIVAKLGVPPFLLGLSWSTTERMSRQQADILTSELACYRRLLEPVMLRICEAWLRLEGFSCEPAITWNTINLQDEGELAKARLNNAQADRVLAELARAQKGENSPENPSQIL